MKPISRKLTISIKDEEKGTELGSLTAEFDLPTDYTEICDSGGNLFRVAPSVDETEFKDRLFHALKTAAYKLGE